MEDRLPRDELTISCHCVGHLTTLLLFAGIMERLRDMMFGTGPPNIRLQQTALRAAAEPARR
jgi:hypothetical protein